MNNFRGNLLSITFTTHTLRDTIYLKYMHNLREILKHFGKKGILKEKNLARIILCIDKKVKSTIKSI